MGYSLLRFVRPVDQHLRCPICSHVLESPVLTQCGHTFCRTCLLTWLAQSGVSASWPGPPDRDLHDDHSGTCPECRSMVSVGELSQVICLRNLILSLEVTCENSDRGCPAHFPLERNEVHLQTCGHAPVSCCGCQGMINRAELTSH
ncbi:hypothetical protein EGW08_003145, partial [Elysia chlorotica]